MSENDMMGCHVSEQLSNELNAALPVHVSYGFDGHEYILVPTASTELVQSYIARHRTDIALQRRGSIESHVVFDVAGNHENDKEGEE